LSLVEQNIIGLSSGSVIPESTTTPCNNNQNIKYEQPLINLIVIHTSEVTYISRLCKYATSKAPSSFLYQILMVQSDEPDNKYLSQQIRDVTASVCALSVIVHSNVSRSHS